MLALEQITEESIQENESILGTTAFYIVDENEKTVHIFRILYNRREWQYLL